MTSPENTPLKVTNHIPLINYELLVLAAKFYEQRGYMHLMDAPWVVPPKFAKLTAPAGSTLFPVKDEGVLVASGEQSFLYAHSQGSLPFCDTAYSFITPCFRDDKLDTEHYRYFMKLELIALHGATRAKLISVMQDCLEFFNQHVPSIIKDTNMPDPLAVPNTSFDIVAKGTGVELGSYGIREHPELGRWIYATGCAEPRLSGEIWSKAT